MTESNIEEVIASLKDETLLALDSETTGLEESDRPFSFSIACSWGEWNFDTRVIPGLWEHPSVKILFATERSWILQNAKFDIRMLESVGIVIEGTIRELTVAARLTRNDHLTYSLGPQAKRYDLAKMDAAMAYIKEHKLYEERTNNLGEKYKNPRFLDVPLELIEEYACHDARITYDLYIKHYLPAMMGTPGVLKVWDNESRLTAVCYRMERRGLYLDRAYTIQAMHHEQEKVDSGRQMFLGLTGSEYRNSAKHIGPLLGYELPLTEEGNPSLTDDVLEMILTDGSPEAKRIAETVRSIRTSEKRISTYYKSYLEKVGPDNLIHPQMWPGGTRTGRFSYSDPNLQNLHKDKKSDEKFVVRGCFRPRPGNVFVSADYAQMEYRLTAAYANERSIIDAVMSGTDFHTAMANMVGVDRDTAKTLNFAILYGAGPDKIALMLGITRAEAERLKIKYFMAMPRVEQLINNVIAKAKDTGVVYTWLGRPLHFGWHKDPKTGKQFHDSYSAPNHLIQGGGADVVKVAMNRIHQERPDIPMVLQIHDQLVFDMPLAHARDSVPDIRRIMESSFPEKNGMRLTVDITWSEGSLAARDFKPWEAN